MARLRRLTRLTIFFMTTLFIAPLATGLEAVWVLGGQPLGTGILELELATTGAFPGEGLTPLVCTIRSPRGYEQVQVHFELRQENGAIVAEAQQAIELAMGLNECTFHLDGRSLAPGNYVASIALHFARNQAPIEASRVVKRISSSNMSAEMAALAQRLDDIEAALDANAAEAARYPYSRLRLRVARQALDGAAHAMASESWPEADQRLNYLFRAVFGVEAGVAFGSVVPELSEPVHMPQMAGVAPGNGGFVSAAHQPVFLLGRKIHNPDPAYLDWLRHLGFSVVVVDHGPGLRSFLEHAKAANIAVAVQYNPETLAHGAGAPLTLEGFPDVASSTGRAAFAAALDADLGWLQNEEMLLTVSLAENPRFQIRSKEVHKAFIERVRYKYEDRQLLNQTWHAHLSTFDDIVVWGSYLDDRPDPEIEHFHYPNRRAYQHDWQTFHRELVSQYFFWARSQARNQAPRLPLTVTMPDSLFELGETRFGVDREQLAEVMDITGCSAVVETDDEFFAINYPRQAAFYTYMRSLQPQKPLFNLDKELLLNPGHQGRETYQYVRTVLWESLVSGLNGLAISNEEFFQNPDALEALAVTNLDAIRLAPILMAFHQAPTEVGIVFSNSAKMLDDGTPHLESAQFAFEGTSFSGYKLRYITEADIRNGVLSELEAVVLPETPAVDDVAFTLLDEFVEGGGIIARVGTPIPYDPQGSSRTNVLRNTPNTVLVRGMNLPTEYLHAMDAMIDEGNLSQIARPVNSHGYPMEGVKTRYVVHEGVAYLYIVNIREEAAHCYLTGGQQSGRDLIQGRNIQFPRILAPLDPMLIRLDPNVNEVVVTAQGAP